MKTACADNFTDPMIEIQYRNQIQINADVFQFSASTREWPLLTGGNRFVDPDR